MFHLALTAMYLVVMPSICLAVLSKRKVELYIGIMLPFFAVWLYLTGMLNSLRLGRATINIAIWMLFVSVIVYGFYMIRKKKGKVFFSNIRNNMVTPGLFIFLIGIIFSAYMSFGRIYSGNDEFSHWGRVVKVLFLYNELPIKNEQALSIIMFKSYPLGTSLIGYLFAVQCNSLIFCDYAHFFASEILIFSFFTLLTYNTRWKNTIFAFVFVISIFFCCLSFSSGFFTNVYVDALLGISLASCLYVSFVFYNPTIMQAIYLAIQLSFLILIKQSGVGLAILIVLVPVSISVIQSIRGLIKRTFRFKSLCGFIPLSAFFINTIHKYSLKGTRINFSGEKITLNNFYDNYFFNSNGIFQEVWDKMINQLFFAKQTAFLIPTSYFAAIVVLSLVIYLVGKVSDKKNTVLKSIPYLLLLGLIIYSITLLLYYNFSFSAYEGSRLASFDRYISTYMIFAVLTCCSISFSILNQAHTKKEMQVFLYLILLIPFLKFSDFTVIKSYFDPITNSNMRFVSIFDQIVKQNILDDDKFFIISQEDKGYYGLIPSVYFPNNYKSQITSWGKPQYEGDMWSRDYSDKQVENMLNNYQYCYLLKSNKYFVDHYAKFFSEPPNKPHVLYRCLSGKFVPVPLKEFVFDFQKCSLLDVTKKTKAYVNYSARNGDLRLGLMKNGEIELKPISDCPLWNGRVSKINISFGKIRGEARLYIKLNEAIVYDDSINESTDLISLNIPGVIISNLTFNLVGQKEFNNILIDRICLQYDDVENGGEHLYDVSPFHLFTNGKMRFESLNRFSLQGKQLVLRSLTPTNNPIPDSGKLLLSGKIINKGKTTPTIYVGWSPFTKDNKEIRPINICALSDTDTFLTADLESGSNTMYVSDASKWKVDSDISAFFNCSIDSSDLPNFSNIDYGNIKILSIVQQNDKTWKIEIKPSPISTIKKGTLVRLHKTGGSFLYSSIFKLMPSEETSFEGIIDGFSDKNDYSIKNGWPKGSKYTSIIILSYSGKDDWLEFHDLKLIPVNSDQNPSSETPTDSPDQP